MDIATSQSTLAEFAGAASRGPVAAFLDRGSERSERLKRLIVKVAREYAKNHQIELIPHDGSEWISQPNAEGRKILEEYASGVRKTLEDVPFFMLKPREILYPIRELQDRPESEFLAQLRHHIGHALHSDRGCLFEGQRLAESQGYLPSSWLVIHRALESTWIEKQLANKRSKDEQTSEYFSAATLREIEREVIGAPQMVKIANAIRYYGISAQLIPSLRGTALEKSFEKIKPLLDECFNGSSSQKNFVILRDSIWPEIRDLEKSALSEQALDSLQSDLVDRRVEFKLSDAAATSVPVIESVTADVPRQNWWRRVGRYLRQIVWLTREEKVRNTIEREQRRQEKALEKKRKLVMQTNSAMWGMDPKTEPARAPTVEKVFEAMKPEQRALIEADARKLLDAKQVGHLSAVAPELCFDRGRAGASFHLSHRAQIDDHEVAQLRKAIASYEEELNKRDERERGLPEDTGVKLRELQETIMKQELHMSGFDESERPLYLKFVELEAPLRGYLQRFVSSFAEMLPKAQTMRREPGYRNGSKLNFARLIDDVVSPGTGKVYERRIPALSEEPEIFIWLLIDHSPSMKDNNKMVESLKTATFWARVLRDLEIPFAIKFFAEEVSSVLKIGEDYDDPRVKAKPKLVRLGSEFPNSTDIGKPLEMSLAEFRALPRNDFGRRPLGAVFVISDSGANVGKTGVELRMLIDGMQRELLVENFLLNAEPNEIAQAKLLFGEDHVLVSEKFDQFPRLAIERLGLVLYRFVKQFQREVHV